MTVARFFNSPRRGAEWRKLLKRLGQAFGDLKVRPKLIVLHNLFFLVLSAAVYAALAPELPPRGEVALTVALAVVYLLAVLLLELIIMPAYVYGPLRTILEADDATQRDDTARELIPEQHIRGDEIGQIMRSRNAAIAKLRQQERALAEAAADLRHKNEMLETARRSLADQDRLASLGLLSASVTHELNTPLAVLQGSIEKLIETVDDATAQQRLERMKRVTDRLRTISASLLEFARDRRHPFEPVAVRAVIDEAWLLVSIDEKASRVTFSSNSVSDVTVLGNSDRLVQVFVNLLRNALLAVRPGGSIAVSATPFERQGRNWISIAVEDDGPGIPPDVLPQIFEAFVTSRLDSRGTGLGLAVADGIVQQHGGTIEASNRPGGGARLEVCLPAAAPAQAQTGGAA